VSAVPASQRLPERGERSAGHLGAERVLGAVPAITLGVKLRGARLALFDDE
jgi:hypothetical protein